jgi:very-short-patch-repair endonuclease
MPVLEIVRGQKITKKKLRMAKELRSDMTEAEVVLWERLRNNQLNGYHFRRQQLIDGFIIDFYCHSINLVIEIDGPIHDSQLHEDAIRDDALISKGLTVLHFRNDEILSNLEHVLERIQATPLPPLPLREGGQGG